MKPPPPPNHIISVRYFIMDCARCAWAYITTAEIYCGHVRWCSFLIFWVLRWLRPSCIAVGCDQQLIRWVMTPPAQHHTGTEHAQHLQADSKGSKEKLLSAPLYPSVNLAGNWWESNQKARTKDQFFSNSNQASWPHGLMCYCRYATMGNHPVWENYVKPRSFILSHTWDVIMSMFECNIRWLAMLSLSLLWEQWFPGQQRPCWAVQHSRNPLTQLGQSCCQLSLCWQRLLRLLLCSQ